MCVYMYVHIYIYLYVQVCMHVYYNEIGNGTAVGGRSTKPRQSEANKRAVGALSTDCRYGWR